MFKRKIKLYEFDDGEQHWIVAYSKKQAKKYYIEIYGEDMIKDLTIRRVRKGKEELLIDIREDIDLYEMVNRYKVIDDHIRQIDLWKALEFHLLCCDIKDQKYNIPEIFASSLYY